MPHKSDYCVSALLNDVEVEEDAAAGSKVQPE